MQRDKQIQQWLKHVLPSEFRYESASSDASFRHYYRVYFQDKNGQQLTSILMDAPPDKEDTGPFIKVATMLAEVGVNVPLIEAKDTEQGFLLLTDLGDDQYLSQLTPLNADRLYTDALDSLLRIQKSAPRGTDRLPAYDHAMLWREMELFREWYVGKHLGYRLTSQESTALDQAFEYLAVSALAQPRVFVHRDYHSRNLMLTPVRNPGIIDFQDAVVGAVTYDVVSLLRDCYIQWPRARTEAWALSHLHNGIAAGFIPATSDQTLLVWFDLMGVQRHLKASGIFARLYHRDGKSGYLKDIPRTLSYIEEVSPRYAGLAGLAQLLARLHKQ